MPSPTSIACPHCGQIFSVPPEQMPNYAGQAITCTRCKRSFTVGAIAAQPATELPLPPPITAYSSGGLDGPLRTSTISVVALVLGILSFVIPILAAIGAIVCGIIGITQTGVGKAKGRGMAIAGLALGIIGLLIMPVLLMVSILIPSLTRAREAANRIKCASNLKQIGLACLMYSNNDRDGALPDTLEHLVAAGDMSNVVFICPSTKDTVSTATTPKAIAVDLAGGGHDSYIYVGSGLNNTASASTVIAYEPLANHKSEGANVLFGDGHVDFLRRAQMQSIINELKAGENPPSTLGGRRRGY